MALRAPATTRGEAAAVGARWALLASALGVIGWCDVLLRRAARAELGLRASRRWTAP